MAKRTAEELPTFKYDLEACVRWAHKRNWDDVGKVMIFLPPVLILMFGSVVGWTIQGFRP
jgi:hypothetical protein